MKWITGISVSSVEAGKSSVPIDGEGHTKGGSFLACVEPGQFTEFSWGLSVYFLCHSDTPEAQSNLEDAPSSSWVVFRGSVEYRLT